MLVITLVRHGNTNANNERWIQGQLDTELNKNGLKQAWLCGERLKDNTFDYAYCSDLKRCKQTAEGIMHHHPQVAIEYLFGLREADFGALSGSPIKALHKESHERKVSVNQIVIDNGGESLEAFDKRIIDTFDSIVKNAIEKNYKSILIVTHGGPLKHLANCWSQRNYRAVKPSIKIANMAHENTAITKIAVTDDGKGYVYEFNSSSHLGANIKHNAPPTV